MKVNLKEDGRDKLKKIQSKYGKTYTDDVTLVEDAIDGMKNKEVNPSCLVNVINFIDNNTIKDYFIALKGEMIGLVVLSDDGNIKCNDKIISDLSNDMAGSVLTNDEAIEKSVDEMCGEQNHPLKKLLTKEMKNKYLSGVNQVNNSVYDTIIDLKNILDKEITVVKGA